MPIRFHFAALTFVAAALVATPSYAQIPTVSPGGGAAAPYQPAPPAAPPRPTPIVVNVPGADGKVAPSMQAEADGGFYYSDDVGLIDKPGDSGLYGAQGSVPDTHVIRQGDTLWEICGSYFSNPWEWPRIWSYNPTITNPHWIYPGDVVRLSEKAAMAGDAAIGSGSDEDGVNVVADSPSGRSGFSLKRLAFLDASELDNAITIAGSVEEKLLLSDGDAVYLKYGNNKPHVGQNYSIYEEVEKVVHPKTGKVIGYFVRIRGEVQVLSVRKDRRARATISRSENVIERGAKVGKIKKVYANIVPRRNEKTLQGLIVGRIEAGELIGSQNIVLLDRGKGTGLKVGNRLFVVRRGDAYPAKTNPYHQIGLDDRRYPARAIGELLVVDVGEHISMALVTVASQEIGIGDMALMRKDAL